MKRLVLFCSALLLAGCGDTPSQPAIDLEPQLANAPAVGSGATWHFTSTVTYVYPGGSTVDVDDVIEGSVTFTLGESYVYTCDTFTAAQTSWTYTHDGIEYTGDAEGNAVASTCGTPYFLLWGNKGTWPTITQWVLDWLPNPTSSDEFPLVPPDLAGPGPLPTSSPIFYVYDYETGEGFVAAVTSFSSGPQGKDDCKNGGWEMFAFRNQGQCVRFVETGKDSR